MTNWLVLGLGNALSGADAFGPGVVAHLRGSTLPSTVTLEDAHTDLLAWVDRFGEYSDVVLVDVAAGAGARWPAGDVAVVDETTFSRWEARSPGAHELSPIAAVKVFRALERGGDGSPAFHLVALFVEEQDFATPPSPSAIAAGAEAVRGLLRVCLAS